MQLTAQELRVLGCLIEKQMTTPDVYPMTLNSLVTACNQSTNREPVVDYSPSTVTEALDGLRTDHKLARIVHSGAGSRVDKYKHVLDERLGLTPPEVAVMSVLMLRGPQTLGEIKIRTERSHGFASLEDVDRILDRLSDPTIGVDPAEFPTRSDAGMLRSSATAATPTEDAEQRVGYQRPWDGPLVVRLPRQPGQKEIRVAQLLGGPIDLEALARHETMRSASTSDGGGSWRERCAELENSVGELRAEIEVLRAEFAEFRSQF
jgi:uncharacterized protein